MCIVGCIQYHKPSSCHGNRRGLSLPQNDMETQDQPTEQDHDESRFQQDDEESGEVRARDLSRTDLHQHTGIQTSIRM